MSSPGRPRGVVLRVRGCCSSRLGRLTSETSSASPMLASSSRRSHRSLRSVLPAGAWNDGPGALVLPGSAAAHEEARAGRRCCRSLDGGKHGIAEVGCARCRPSPAQCVDASVRRGKSGCRLSVFVVAIRPLLICLRRGCCLCIEPGHSDGLLRVVGRRKRMRLVGGGKVHAGLIGRVLRDHPGAGAVRVRWTQDEGLVATVAPAS